MKTSEKTFDTGLRILEVLKILLNEDVSKNELIEKLRYISNIESVYTYEVILKYFNTLEISGLKLNKNGSEYALGNALMQVPFDKDELKTAVKLIKNADILHNKKDEKAIKCLFGRFKKYINSETGKAVIKKALEEKYELTKDGKYEQIISALNKISELNLLIKITYKQKNNLEDTITCELKEIVTNKTKKYIICYVPSMGRNRKILLDTIIKITQLPQKAGGVKFLNTIVFEIYGRLANLYKLRPNEKILNFTNNHIIISNAEEDREILLRRLLKYGENCKIIKPQSVKDEFLNMTCNILQNLEENDV